MAFMSKQELSVEADRLGIDISNMKYQEQQKVILAALKEEKDVDLPEPVELHMATIKVPEPEPAVYKQEAEPDQAAAPAHRRSYSEIVNENGERRDGFLTDKDLMAPMRGRETILSPEYHHGIHQTVGFKENLGKEYRYESVDYVDDWERGALDLRDESEKFSSFRIAKDENGNPLTTGEDIQATTGLPLEMAKITFVPDQDLVPRCTWRGRTGYLYKHPMYPNIKDLLIQCGRYEDFKGRFEHEPAVWYANGLLCCDINMVHSLFDRIEREAQEIGRRGY